MRVGRCAAAGRAGAGPGPGGCADGRCPPAKASSLTAQGAASSRTEPERAWSAALWGRVRAAALRDAGRSGPADLGLARDVGRLLRTWLRAPRRPVAPLLAGRAARQLRKPRASPGARVQARRRQSPAERSLRAGWAIGGVIPDLVCELL